MTRVYRFQLSLLARNVNPEYGVLIFRQSLEVYTQEIVTITDTYACM